jgi:hypothetical protein
MRSRSVFELPGTPADFDADFFPATHDLRIGSGGQIPHQDVEAVASLPEYQSAVSEHGDDSDNAPVASSLAFLESFADRGHETTTDPTETSVPDVTGSGSINVLGLPIDETNADNGGLHTGPSIATSFAGPNDALFGPTASTPIAISISQANLALTAVGLNSVEAVSDSAHPTSEANLNDNAPLAGMSDVAFLENSGEQSPPTVNSAVSSSGATAAQVQAALDESSLSVNGSGIKVGVLSDSFDDLGGAAADEADGALPSASNIQILKDLSSGGTDEGRAMMEIIHDIAPGASLAFYTAFDSEQDFANGILALANAGAKVIVDDVGYFDEPFFQNGIVAQAIQTVEAEGVTYVTAAGNDGSNGYQAAFSATSGTFDGHALTNAENFGGSLTQTVTINTEGTGDDVPLVLEWNQAYGAVSSSTADLELLVFQNGRLVGTATNAGDGEPRNPWIEYDFPASGTYQIAIENTSTPGTDAGLIFKEIAEGDGLPATISGANSGTVVGHSMTPGAITAGAVSAADTPAFGFSPASESFSSSGAGTELLFNNNGMALSSPDVLSPVAVSGVDDVATSVSGGLSDFYGTSAASASLAGVAALILSADPNLTPAQVESIMEQTALSMGNSAVAGTGLVQVDPAVTEALALVTQVIQTDGSTELARVGGAYSLYNTGTSTGPELHYGGSLVTVGEFGAWSPIGAVQVAGGYDVAWHDSSSGLYTIWSTDANGNYLSNLIGAVSGNSTALETYETTFNQDLNGDGTIGVPQVVIHNDGTTNFVEVGNSFFLDPASGGTGPELHYDGSVVTAGEFGTWTPIGAVQVTGGYDVAWHDPSSGLYTIWNTDANGNYMSNLIGAVAGNSAAFESYETVFGWDLNGDGTIGVLQVVIHNDGTTKFVEVGNNFFLDPAAGGTGPELQYGGSAVTAGEFGTWTPIGAVQVAGGYDVAWHDPSSGLYTIWNTDANGNYISNLIGAVAGNSAAFESYETVFGWDLNGDGTIGVPQVVIHNDGTTKFVEVGNNFFLDPAAGGTGPELQYGGSAVTAGEFGTWTPIGAVQVAGGGYDIAWHDTSSDLYTVWRIDTDGNYLSNLIPASSGNSSAVESMETVFNQDLNGDGTIGVPSSSQMAGSGQAIAQLHSTSDNFQFNSNSAVQPSAFALGSETSVVTAGHDGFAFALDHGPVGAADFVHATDFLPLNATAPTESHGAPTGGHQGEVGDAPNIAHAQWWAHHSDFHLT